MTHSFQSTIDLLDAYYAAADRRMVPGFQRDLASELRDRLEQMGWLLDRIRDLERRASVPTERARLAFASHLERLARDGLDFASVPPSPDMAMTAEEIRESDLAQFEMRLYSDAFYFFAGRARALVRHKANPLPGLGSFEAAGVRDVRNHLIEHPEGSASHVFALSWAWGGPQGPVLKAVRHEGQEDTFPDAGLYVNAQVFRDHLEALLTSAIANLGV